jgi:putative oxidoreductase
MRALSFPSVARFRDLAPFVLRGPLGVILAYHGWQKFDNGLQGFSGFVESLDVPLPDIVGPAVALLELVGGIMLVAGLLTRVVALLVAIEMVFTTLLVKIDIGLIAPMGGGAGAEIDVALWAGMVTLVFIGPGVLAIDRIIGIERGRRA